MVEWEFLYLIILVRGSDIWTKSKTLFWSTLVYVEFMEETNTKDITNNHWIKVKPCRQKQTNKKNTHNNPASKNTDKINDSYFLFTKELLYKCNTWPRNIFKYISDIWFEMANRLGEWTGGKHRYWSDLRE